MRHFSIPENTTSKVVEVIPFQVPVHLLPSVSGMYGLYPPFQREYVWRDKEKFELVESLVLGYPIDDIKVCTRLDGGKGKWILDGQQRFTTVLRYLLALQAVKEGRPIPRDEYGEEYFYFPLTEAQEARMMGRALKFADLINVDENNIVDIYLHINNHVSLTTAEQLWASLGPLRDVAASVYMHPYFSTIYGRKDRSRRFNTRRKQTFQMAIYPSVLQMFGGFADLQGARIKQLTKGTRKDLVYPGMAQVVNENMNHVLRLFTGVNVEAMSELIIQYQAVYLLRLIGCDLNATSEGALCAWYRRIEALNTESRKAGFMNLFAQMTNRKSQKQYWKTWLSDIVYSGAVDLGSNSQETFNRLERVIGWIKHDGVCQRCNNPHVQLSSIDFHVFMPADYHRLSTNCAANANKQAIQTLAPARSA